MRHSLFAAFIFGCTASTNPPNTAESSSAKPRGTLTTQATAAPNASVVSRTASAEVPEASTAGAPSASEAANSASAAQPTANSSASATAVPPAPPTPPAAPAWEALGEGLHQHAIVQQQVGFYAVLTPPGYDAPENKQRRYPIVVILHGSGSTELGHGKLSNDFGREDVIYVLPRAPYASAEVFIENDKPGWTAWPHYPELWGDYDSATFPKAEVEPLKLSEQYTTQIAGDIQDARKRYRANADRVVVFGHSQGAGFAHLLAARYPWLVKAYFAYAGHYASTTEKPEGATYAKALQRSRIEAMYVHHELDDVVKVSETRAVDEFLSAKKVKHTTSILPGGNHRVTPEVKALARSFVRRWCCNESSAATQ